MVWPNYARLYGPLFRHGDLEGSVKKRVCGEVETDVQAGLDESMEDTLKWASNVIIEQLKVENDRPVATEVRDPNNHYELCHCHDGILGRVRQFSFDLL